MNPNQSPSEARNPPGKSSGIPGESADVNRDENKDAVKKAVDTQKETGKDDLDRLNP